MMDRPRVVELSPRAVREIERARRWWRQNRDKAVEDDLLELVARLETVAEHVGVEARNMPGVRRVLLPRIRVYVYFRVDASADRVQIAALVACES